MILLAIRQYHRTEALSFFRLAAKMSSIIGLAKEAGLNVSFDI